MILGHTFPVITDILSTPLPPGEFREELGFVAAEIDFDEAVGDENEVDGCIEFIAFGCGATARRIYVLIYHITTRPHIIFAPFPIYLLSIFTYHFDAFQLPYSNAV